MTMKGLREKISNYVHMPWKRNRENKLQDIADLIGLEPTGSPVNP